MVEPFNLIPKANTSLGDKFEQLWLACSRLIVAELDCFDRHTEKTSLPGAPDPCTSIRAQATSCLDKSQNYEAWEELVQCRDKQLAMQHVKTKHIQANPPEPISCHELVAELQFHRRAFFESSVTKPVSKWMQVLGKAKSKCRAIRVKYLDCAQEMGDQCIPCLDLSDAYSDCIYTELAPEEFKIYKKCRLENPNDICTKEKAVLKYKLDSQAVEATQSIGMAKSDYMRYGGPYRAFETMVYPFMHLPEAQDQIAKFSSNL